MSTVTVKLQVPGTVHQTESLWYDTRRWPAWVEGLERVEEVGGEWPRTGGFVRWRSGPAGRGTVTERAIAYEPRAGQTVEVEDDSVSGQQSVNFTPHAKEQTEIELTLDYEIKGRRLLTPLVDLLFIRRAMVASLRATLDRFRVEAAAPAAASEAR